MNCKILMALRLSGLAVALALPISAVADQTKDEIQDQLIMRNSERLSNLEGRMQMLGGVLALLQGGQLVFQLREHKKR